MAIPTVSTPDRRGVLSGPASVPGLVSEHLVKSFDVRAVLDRQTLLRCAYARGVRQATSRPSRVRPDGDQAGIDAVSHLDPFAVHVLNRLAIAFQQVVDVLSGCRLGVMRLAERRSLAGAQ